MELSLNRHFVEMLRELSATGTECLIVGGHALGAHGYVRATMDFDMDLVDADKLERMPQ